MYPICVRFQSTIAHIPETEAITTNTAVISRTSTDQETNTDAGSTSTEIISTSNTPSVTNTSQDELVTYIEFGESRSNDDDANEADIIIYNDTTDGSIKAATNVTTSGIAEITIINNDYVISKTSLTPLTTASRFTKLPNLNSHKCVSRWTPWVNKDKPWVNKDNMNVDIGESDHEFLTPEELEIFCPRGNITKVECMVDSVHPIPYYSTGEIVRCDKHHGLVCNNADNFPIPCNDYKIRYYCICPVETTKPTFAMKSTSKTTTNIKPKPTHVQHRKTFLVTIQPIDSTSDKHLVKPTATKSHQASTKQASPSKCCIKKFGNDRGRGQHKNNYRKKWHTS
ncbi:Hypothetical predicted protein [Mytilus galloprovincialis]|uniref:WxxW domain-containing protein n=1 Tax=Mytilus galloprovincialis TaxID=29158 RepID=A0A8B6FSY6_MYTGA|nr:Hypothetical predicted protein [Mytilus galloprovincialis]